MDKAVEELDKFRSLADIGDVCTLAVTQGLTPPSTCTALNDALSTLSAAAGAAAAASDATKNNPVLLVNFAFIERDLQDPDWGVLGTKLALVVFVPARQQNPTWVGDVAVTIDIPRAGIFSAWLGQLPLTSLPRGQWSTLEFNVPTNVRDALLGDTGNARISIQPNIATCPTLAERQSGNVFSLDNLRFTGQLTDRQITCAAASGTP